MVEGLYDADVKTVTAELVAGLMEHGATRDISVNHYRLLFSISG